MSIAGPPGDAVPGATPVAPLAGVRIAVTRATERGAPLADALRRVGATVHEIPLTRIESLDAAPMAAAVATLARYDWVLLTSVNAVEHLARAVGEARAEAVMATRRLAAVGQTTAAAIERHGWREPVVPPEQSHAEAMLDLLAARTDIEGTRMLYPAAAGARDVLPAGLRALGAEVDVIPVYRSAPDPEGQARIRLLADEGGLDLVTLAAPSAVDALLDALLPEQAGRLPVACIGPVTARAARTAGFPVRVEATAAVMEGWVRQIVAALQAPPSKPAPLPPAP